MRQFRPFPRDRQSPNLAQLPATQSAKLSAAYAAAESVSCNFPAADFCISLQVPPRFR
jgi:hypothetical protein